MKYWLIAIWKSIPANWWVVLAPFGSIIAAFVLWFLFGGLFIKPVDPKIGQYLAEFAVALPKATDGNRRAQYRVGVILRDGLAGKKEPAAALKWFERAAKANYVPAQFALGQMFAKGEGVRQNVGRAAEWYGAAAGFAHHKESQYELGNLYFNGRGVGHDYSTAVSWFRKAAMRGHAGAQTVMGSMYEKGWGVERDLAEAFAWYSLAAEQPDRVLFYRKDVDPEANVANLKSGMSRLQLKNGRLKLKQLRKHLADQAKR